MNNLVITKFHQLDDKVIDLVVLYKNKIYDNYLLKKIQLKEEFIKNFTIFTSHESVVKIDP